MIPQPYATDTHRIADLPRRGLPAVDMTAELARPGCPDQLRALQSAVLFEAQRNPFGCVAALAVGKGKAWLAHLLPAICGARLGIVLAPKGTLDNLERERHYLDKHFRLTSTALLSYGKLSRPRLLPDGLPNPESWLDVYAHGLGEEEVVLVVDEAHKLARKGQSATVARVKAFLHHATEPGQFCSVCGDSCLNPNGRRNRRRFFPMSGTIDDMKIERFAHIFQWALGPGSPLPINKHDLRSWAACLNYRARAERADWARIHPLWQSVYPDLPLPWEERRAAIAAAFRYRMRCTPGVVASSPEDDSDLPELRLYAHTPEPPQETLDHLVRLEDLDVLPNGDIVEQPPEKWLRARQLACGYYPKLEWPNGVDYDWLDARSKWHRHVRSALEGGRTPGRDSPRSIRAIVEHELGNGQEPIHWALRDWLIHENKPEPLRPPQWFSYWLIDWALDFLARAPRPVIVWVDDVAVQEEFARRGLPVYGAGTRPDEVEGPRHAVLSMDAHHEGKNLQYSRIYNRALWADCLVLTPMPGGKINEQLIGRIHRPLQPAPIVNVHYIASPPPFRDALREARGQARHTKRMHGTPQKLLQGAWVT